jgi:hypothetical protein
MGDDCNIGKYAGERAIVMGGGFDLMGIFSMA